MAVVHGDGTGLIWWVLHGAAAEGLLVWVLAYLVLAGTCLLLGSGPARYGLAAAGARLPRRLLEALEGPHILVLAQFPLMLATILKWTEGSHWPLAPHAGVALCAAAAAAWLAPALCAGCRAHPCVAGLLTVLGTASLSLRVGTIVGACLLLVGIPYEVGALRTLRGLSDRLPAWAARNKPGEAGLVVGAMLWSAILTALPALHPVLVAVLTLGVMISFYVHVCDGSRRPLGQRAVRLAARVGGTRPYRWLIRRSIPEATAEPPATDRCSRLM